jgi:hypothetical protein
MDRMLAWLAAAGPDPLDVALTEIDAAIALVVLGVAVTVRICSLRAAEDAAPTAAARAQAAGVAFRIGPVPDGPPTLIVGPRLRPTVVEPGR